MGTQRKHAEPLSKTDKWSVVMAHTFLLEYTLNTRASLIYVDGVSNNGVTLKAFKVTLKSVKMLSARKTS